MKSRPVLFLLLFALALYHSFADEDGGSDAQVAGQYVKWAEQAIEEDRWADALTALERASGFENVSSDISYLLAVTRSHEKKSRYDVIEALDAAIETNRWVNYNEDKALLLKANQLAGMHRFSAALSVIDQMAADIDAAHDREMVRLLALRGMASVPGNAHELARFRSLVLTAMDRYPRSPAPLRIFFEYARNRKPDPSESDLDLLELALRRLPFLLETDPELAWLAAPFMREADAIRLISSYRAGGFSRDRNFRPSPASIPAALNLGLIGDEEAIGELFAVTSANGEKSLDKDIITEIDSLLRSEEGRKSLTEKLLSFTGVIFSNETEDGYIESRVTCRSGVIQGLVYDRDTDGLFNMKISFSADGVPSSAEYRIAGEPESMALVKWERYPSVEQIVLAEEKFLFRPADFQFAPVAFIGLGGSNNYSPLAYPAPAPQNMELTRRVMVSFCASLIRPSVEIDGAQEQIFLERGIPWQAVETLNGKQVSITEFERGMPTLQRIDLDLDGRMETVRRFRPAGPDFSETLDYRSLIASSESDWTGDGQYKTGEVYLPDGSVVYTWDMDGSGVMNYSETGNNEENK